MKTFKNFINEIRMAKGIRPPFFIAVQRGLGYQIEAEVLTDNDDTQRDILSKYKNAWIIPGRESGGIKVGQKITKRFLEKLYAVPAKYYFSEEVEEITEVAAKKTVRVLNGKRVVQYRCPPGHHKKKRGGKVCVRTVGKRRYKVVRGAKKAARKRKARKTTIARRRSRSMRKRRGMGL